VRLKVDHTIVGFRREKLFMPSCTTIVSDIEIDDTICKETLRFWYLRAKVPRTRRCSLRMSYSVSTPTVRATDYKIDLEDSESVINR
jgi:hypothetical protein